MKLEWNKRRTLANEVKERAESLLGQSLEAIIRILLLKKKKKKNFAQYSEWDGKTLEEF